MGRSTVSLTDDQEEWIQTQMDELDLSKSKVIRECVTAVMGDASLFTASVADDDAPSEDQIEAIESRISAIEDAIAKSTDESDATRASPPPTAFDSSVDAASSEAAAPSSPQESPPSSSAQIRSSQTSSTDSLATSQSHTETDASATTVTDTAPEPSTEQPAAASPPQPTESEPASSSEGDVPAEPTIESVRSYLDDTIPDPERREAIATCWLQLHDRGTTHPKSLKQIYDQHNASYDSPDAWWTEGVQPILDTLPGVEAPEDGGTFYRFKY